VTFFGLDELERPNLNRFFRYHIISGGGPTTDSGLASITTLAIHNESLRCDYCQHVHIAEQGGPAAALAKAIAYLDSYHSIDHVWKVQSEIRGIASAHPTTAAT
jgi:hypothetical protein